MIRNLTHQRRKWTKEANLTKARGIAYGLIVRLEGGKNRKYIGLVGNGRCGGFLRLIRFASHSNASQLTHIGEGDEEVDRKEWIVLRDDHHRVTGPDETGGREGSYKRKR